MGYSIWQCPLLMEALLASVGIAGRDGQWWERCHVLRWAKHLRGNAKQMWKCWSANANTAWERAPACEGCWKEKNALAKSWLWKRACKPYQTQGELHAHVWGKNFAGNILTPSQNYLFAKMRYHPPANSRLWLWQNAYTKE